MRRSSVLVLLVSLGSASWVGCVGEVGGDATKTGDGGPTGSDTSEGTDSDPPPDDGAPPDDTAAPPDDTATPPPDTYVPPPDTYTPPPPIDTGDPLDSVRDLCVNEINTYRATLGLAPLKRWTAAEICGDGQAKSDSETGKAHGAFGKCGESAQNECPGWPGPPETMIKGCLKMMWAEGPGSNFSTHGHYINMSSTSYTTVSCGFYKTPTGSWWSVQDFR